jgi:hypothetical protein
MLENGRGDPGQLRQEQIQLHGFVGSLRHLGIYRQGVFFCFFCRNLASSITNFHDKTRLLFRQFDDDPILT